MLVTELEAETKWCPFARVAIRAWDVAVAANEGTNDAACKGSLCMQWRWQGFDLPSVPDRKGFCGMSGVPSYA